MVLNEHELFSYLKEFHYPELEKAQSKFANFDCLDRKAKIYIELKSRNTHYDELLIEKMKYDAIVEAAAFLGFDPAYINATPQGIWQFDLTKMDAPDWQEKWLPMNTEFASRGNKTKVVGYLHIDKGKRL